LPRGGLATKVGEEGHKLLAGVMRGSFAHHLAAFGAPLSGSSHGRLLLGDPVYILPGAISFASDADVRQAVEGFRKRVAL
jgi:hypothetical protein